MTRREATQKLRETGQVTWRGVEFLETYNSVGQYTGRYRMWLRGCEAEKQSHSITAAFREAARLRML